MLCVLLSFLYLSFAIQYSLTAEVFVVQPTISLNEETLNLYLYPRHESLLKISLTKFAYDHSTIVIHSKNGPRSFNTSLNHCFYEVPAQRIFGFGGTYLNIASGVLSICENGIRGYIKAIQTSRYPNGAVYYLEPENITSPWSTTQPTWSIDSPPKPHRLRIVPVQISKQTTPESHPDSLSRLSDKTSFHSAPWINRTIDLRPSNYANKTGSNQAPIPLWSSFGTRISSRTRSRRAITVSEPQNFDPSSPDLQPIRVAHRSNHTQPYILELYLVVDEVLTSHFRNKYDKLIHRVNMLMALVNSLYAPFNIHIVVVQLEIWEHDRSQLKVEEHHLLATLAQFKRMHTTVRHDCLHALLGIKDEASRTRGKANPQTMCVYSRCVGYSRDSPRIDVAETARTIAHELGHNFGLRHDTEECKCQGCIMATGVEFGNNILEWSPCSMQDLPTLLEFGMGVCLGDAPVRGIVSVNSVLANESTRNPVRWLANPISPATSVVHVYNWMKQLVPLAAVHRKSSSRARRRYLSDMRAELQAAGLCGNGQLDPGEECDCGSIESCPPELQFCCDVKRCRLRSGSECAGGPCCTVESVSDAQRPDKFSYRCRLLSAGTVCRNASGDCDLPEYCDGKSQWCPADVYKSDGNHCWTDEGERSYCIRGGCRTADGWCRTLWGDKARRGPADCFYENHVWNVGDPADPIANCGKYRPPQSERWEDAKSWPGVACQSWYDAECGRLWCDHRNEKAMLLGWIDSRTRVLRSGQVCAALVYDPVWPAADVSTWRPGNATLPGQRNLNAAGVGIFAANTQDAGMVPDGTPCSHGLCYNGTCTNVYELPSRLDCDCRGQGVCNNRGNCHCKTGFSPPNCEYGGDGGSIDSGPPPPDGRPKPSVVIPLCLLVFIGLPLAVLLVYWYRNHGCTCPRVLGVSMIPTESGLYKPFDRGVVSCVRQCCRCRIRNTSFKGNSYVPANSGTYPILAYVPDDPNGYTNGGWTNGSNVAGKENGFHPVTESNGDVRSKLNGTIRSPVMGNGHLDRKSKRQAKRMTKSNKLDRRILISIQTESGKAQSVNSKGETFIGSSELPIKTEPSNEHENKRMEKMLARIFPTRNLSQTNSAQDVIAPKLVTSETSSKTDATEPKVVQISQPKLETMTYQGEMCTLNEAMSTLKRGEKLSAKSSSSTSTVRRTATVKPPTRPIVPITLQHLDAATHEPIVSRSQSQRLSPRDISNPRLQNTTYTEPLTDLETVRQQRAQLPRSNILMRQENKVKNNSRRLL